MDNIFLSIVKQSNIYAGVLFNPAEIEYNCAIWNKLIRIMIESFFCEG